MTALPYLLDALVVLAFVTLGRRTHAEGLDVGGVAATAWPFLLGMAVGWLLARALRRPLGSLSAGAVVWVATLALGMALRRLAGDGTALPFVIVAAGTTALGLLGWRLAAAAVLRARVSRAPARRGAPTPRSRR